MMLPIRISVSLAPGSYFFCAFAADAATQNAVATVRPTRRVGRFGIVLSLECFASIVAVRGPPSKRPDILRRGTGVVARRQLLLMLQWRLHYIRTASKQ